MLTLFESVGGWLVLINGSEQHSVWPDVSLAATGHVAWRSAATDDGGAGRSDDACSYATPATADPAWSFRCSLRWELRINSGKVVFLLEIWGCFFNRAYYFQIARVKQIWLVGIWIVYNSSNSCLFSATTCRCKKKLVQYVKLVGRSKSQMLDPPISMDKFVGLSSTVNCRNPMALQQQSVLQE